MIYTLMVSDHDGMVDRGEVREHLDEALARTVSGLVGPDPASPKAIAARMAAESSGGPAAPGVFRPVKGPRRIVDEKGRVIG